MSSLTEIPSGTRGQLVTQMQELLVEVMNHRGSDPSVVTVSMRFFRSPHWLVDHSPERERAGDADSAHCVQVVGITNHRGLRRRRNQRIARDLVPVGVGHTRADRTNHLVRVTARLQNPTRTLRAVIAGGSEPVIAVESVVVVDERGRPRQVHVATLYVCQSGCKSFDSLQVIEVVGPVCHHEICPDLGAKQSEPIPGDGYRSTRRLADCLVIIQLEYSFCTSLGRKVSPCTRGVPASPIGDVMVPLLQPHSHRARRLAPLSHMILEGTRMLAS